MLTKFAELCLYVLQIGRRGQLQVGVVIVIRVEPRHLVLSQPYNGGEPRMSMEMQAAAESHIPVWLCFEPGRQIKIPIIQARQ